MRRLLIVSPHFPPVNAPDHQRVRMSLPYYRENGWAPTVLAVDAGCVEALQDPLLATTVPADIPVHRVGALSSRWSRRLGLGNIAYRAWFQLKAEGDRLLSEEKFDLIYFSTTQFVATALGDRWQRSFGTPFVIDLQDPWRTDYYDRPGAPLPPGGWKYRFARWQAARLEERSWRGAAGFTSVSSDYLDQLRLRYSWFESKPTAVIPFGAPEADFRLAEQRTDLAPAFAREPGAVHLVGVGAVGPIMRTAMERLFRAVQTLRRQNAPAAARLRFHFIGTSYAPADRATPSVLPVAESFGVSDLVHEEPRRVGYFTAIKTMLAADALVIPGSDDPAYNPSKIAPCFLARKPTLVLAPADSSLARIVDELAFASIASACDGEPDQVVLDFLTSCLALGGLPLPTTRTEAHFSAVHTARARTSQQCRLFDRAVPV